MCLFLIISYYILYMYLIGIIFFFYSESSFHIFIAVCTYLLFILYILFYYLCIQVAIYVF